MGYILLVLGIVLLVGAVTVCTFVPGSQDGFVFLGVVGVVLGFLGLAVLGLVEM